MATRLMTYTHLTEREFDELRERDELEPEHVYYVVASPTAAQWAWSPDGIGVLWYGSRKQLRRQHGA